MPAEAGTTNEGLDQYGSPAVGRQQPALKLLPRRDG